MVSLDFRVLVAIPTAAVVLLLSGCVSEEDEGKIGVVVTLPPQVEMIEAIGGERIKVTVMVPVGESPHDYSPTPTQMTNVAAAEIFFIVGSGVEFETNFLDEIVSQNRDLTVVNCSEGIAFREMGGSHENHEAEQGSRDPHVWLSPQNARQMVMNLCKGLVGIDPDGREFYETNRDSYISRLEELDEQIGELFEGKEGAAFLVYHPAWGYFADAYGIVELAIEEGGKKPGPAGVAAIIEQAKSLGIKVVFVSPQFSRSSAETIADEIEGEVVTVDPLAQDYIENLEYVAGELAKGLSE
jgi:zinc transport system substrate-binding protein